MAKYLIHAVPKRLWYVNEYLIPSMVAQGIDVDNISVYTDENRDGNLKACMYAFATVDDDLKGTWHLQDDVLICKDFRAITEALDFGLVCGFSSALYDGPGRIGAVKAQDMWFSFPCIRIPNQYALNCSDFVLNDIIGNPVYREFWKDGVNDDWAFRMYVNTYRKDAMAINLAPNLVEHVDYLIGGTANGKERESQCRAQYWKDEDLVEQLAQNLLK